MLKRNKAKNWRGGGRGEKGGGGGEGERRGEEGEEGEGAVTRRSKSNLQWR